MASSLTERGHRADGTMDPPRALDDVLAAPGAASLRPRSREVAERPTMTDVAALAGVSLKTVSRVLNLEPAVSDRARTRVAEAVATLRYRRNTAARSLRSGTGLSSVGLVIADLANPVYGIIAKAVEDVADEHGAVVIVASTEERPEREREVTLSLLDSAVDGLIIAPAAQDHRYLELPRRIGTPLVFLDSPGGYVGADAVLTDNIGGAQMAIEHLIAQGHRRIALVGDAAAKASFRDRHEGYRRALAAAALPYDESIVALGPPDPRRAEAATTQMLDAAEPPTAIFADSNRYCIGVLRAVRAADRPVAVAAFDDFELADMLSVPVSLVSFDAAELGRAAATLLFARLEGDSGPVREIVIPTHLKEYSGGQSRSVGAARPGDRTIPR